jgi:hypothetical protein
MSTKSALQRALQQKRKNLDDEKKQNEHRNRRFRFNAGAKLDNSRVKDVNDKRK